MCVFTPSKGSGPPVAPRQFVISLCLVAGRLGLPCRLGPFRFSPFSTTTATAAI